MSADIKFYIGVQSEYDALGSTEIDPNGIYFLSDTTSIMKNNIKYSCGDIKIATGSAAGIIKPSGDFDITSDGTLSIYKAMSVNSFSNNSGTLEIGSRLTSSNFSWNLNKQPSKLTITAGSQSFEINKTQSGTAAITFAAPLTATTAFTLTATDARKATSTKQTTIYFLNGKYYGVSNITDTSRMDAAFVKGLTRNLVSGRTGSWNVTANAGQYIYFAIPASFGTPAFYVGGFEGGFNKVKTFDFTNASGYTASYNIYRSTNAGLGATTVEVK
nr:MAG TPA: hypothetical protein [Bacteriophage sp.]